MKRSLALASMLISGLALSAVAQTSPATSAPAAPAGPSKVAVIAFQVAVAQTNEGQRSYADLEKKYAPREAQLKTLNDEIETLTKQLQTQGDKLSDEERASRAKTIDDKKKQLERDAEDVKSDGNQAIQEMYSTLASKVFDVLSDYAKKEGYTLVLDMGQQQSPVLFVGPSIDITKPIIEAYNMKSGVPAPPPSAPAPNPAPAAH